MTFQPPVFRSFWFSLEYQQILQTMLRTFEHHQDLAAISTNHSEWVRMENKYSQSEQYYLNWSPQVSISELKYKWFTFSVEKIFLALWLLLDQVCKYSRTVWCSVSKYLKLKSSFKTSENAFFAQLKMCFVSRNIYIHVLFSASNKTPCSQLC